MDMNHWETCGQCHGVHGPEEECPADKKIKKNPEPVSPLPWHRGIGNDSRKIFDKNWSMILDTCAPDDGTSIEHRMNNWDLLVKENEELSNEVQELKRERNEYLNNLTDISFELSEGHEHHPCPTSMIIERIRDLRNESMKKSDSGQFVTCNKCAGTGVEIVPTSMGEEEQMCSVCKGSGTEFMNNLNKSCYGEVCSCGFGLPAVKKIEEVIFEDDPLPSRHPYTQYVCQNCFEDIMRPYSKKHMQAKIDMVKPTQEELTKIEQEAQILQKFYNSRWRKHLVDELYDCLDKLVKEMKS